MVTIKLALSEEIFVWATLYSLKSNFYKTRKSIAFKLQNPRLKQIGLHTFRHWKATMEYHGIPQNKRCLPQLPSFFFFLDWAFM